MAWLDPKFTCRAEYLGGLDGGFHRSISGTLEISNDEFHFFFQPMASVLTHRDRRPWAEVESLWVEGPLSAEKRVTATRIVLLGPVAWAAKKAVKETFFTLATTRGEEALFRAKATIPRCRTELPKFVPAGRLHFDGEAASPASRTGTQSSPTMVAPAVPAVGDLAGQLERLATLHDAGVLSPEQFEAAKQQLLTP